MIKSLKIQGVWWFPDNPECKIAEMPLHELM